MKKIILALSAASLLLMYSCNEEKKTEETVNMEVTKTAEMPPMDSATMMKNWEAYMTPGEMHKILEKSNGTWSSDVTMWMAPDAPPEKSTGTAVNSMILGGRYQESKHNSMMMGMPFEGKAITGYDNAKKVFIYNWIDNMGTGIMHMEGPWDEATKTINFKGKMIDPMTGKELDVRDVFTYVDDNTEKMEMFCTDNGKEFKTMEITFTRKK